MNLFSVHTAPPPDLSGAGSIEQLIARLQGRGLTINVRDYIEFTAVFRKSPARGLQNMKYYLAPIACRNADEQAIFYEVYDQWLQALNPGGKTRLPWWHISKKQLLLLLLLAGLITAVITIFFLYQHRKAAKRQAICITGGLQAGDSLLFDPQCGKIPTATTDTAGRWDFGDGQQATQAGPAKHLFKKDGRYRVHLDLLVKGTVIKTADTALLICPRAEAITISPTEIDSGGRVTAQLLPGVSRPSPDSLRWVVINQNSGLTDTLAYQGTSLSYVARKPGDYDINLVNLRRPVCPLAHGNFTVDRQELPTYELDALPDRPNSALPVNPIFLNLLIWFLALLASGMAGLYILTPTYKQQRPVPEPTGPAGGGLEKAEALASKDELIRQERELVQAAQQLEQKVPAELNELNISETIRRTINSHGLFSPVLTARKESQHYLILIDGSGNYNQDIHLFSYLANYFLQKHIKMDVFYFYQDIRVCYDQYKKQQFTLTELYSRFEQSVLLVISDGHALVSPSFGTLLPAVISGLVQWEKRVLATPVPAMDWDSTERLLAQVFRMMPADLGGWVRLVQLIGDGQPVQAMPADWKSARVTTVDFEDIEALRAYLGDEDLYQWLAAAAIYPRIRWEVLLVVGRQVLENQQAPQKLNYTNLLKIARISWFSEGVFPTDVRLELLKGLSLPNELLARRALLQLMNEPGRGLLDNGFSIREKQLQGYTDSFVLYAHDPRGNKDMEDDARRFMALWEAGTIADPALHIYLANEAGTWQTPVRKLDSNSRGSAGDFIRSYRAEAPGDNKRFFWSENNFFYVFMFLVLALQIATLSGVDFLRDFNDGLLPLAKPDNLATRDVTVRLDTTKCYQSWLGEGKLDKVVLKTGDSTYRGVPTLFTHGSGDTVQDASMINYYFDQISAAQLLAGPATLTLTSNKGKSLRVDLAKVSYGRYTLSVAGSACYHIPNPVYIQYDPAMSSVQAESFRKCLISAGYNAAGTERVAYAGVNLVRYFTPAMKAAAQQLAAAAAACTQSPVSTQYASLPGNEASGAKQRQLEVWLNGKNDCRQVSFNEIPGLTAGNSYYTASLAQHLTLYPDSILLYNGKRTRLKIDKAVRSCLGSYVFYIDKGPGRVRDSIQLMLSAGHLRLLALPGFPNGSYEQLFDPLRMVEKKTLNDALLTGTWLFHNSSGNGQTTLDTIKITGKSVTVIQQNKTSETAQVKKIYEDVASSCLFLYVESDDKSINIVILKRNSTGIFLSESDISAADATRRPTNSIAGGLSPFFFKLTRPGLVQNAAKAISSDSVKIYFDSGSGFLSDKTAGQLDSIARIMRADHYKRILIPYLSAAEAKKDKDLSQIRIDAVGMQLTYENNIDSAMIIRFKQYYQAAPGEKGYILIHKNSSKPLR